MNRFLALATILLLGGLVGESRANADSPYRLQFRTPRALSCRIDEPESLRAAARQPEQWVRASLDDGSTNFVELGSRVVVHLGPETTLVDLLTNGVLQVSRTIGPDVFILQAPDARTAAHEADRLAALPQVRASYPVMRRQADLHGPYAMQPTDTFFNVQWGLENRATNTGASLGPDLNVRAAWPFTRGDGVTIAVVDTGVELTHPELAPSVSGAPHHNFVDGSANGNPVNRGVAAAHGTHVAGLAVTTTNTHRMAGAAPAARLASWSIFTTNMLLATDEQL